VSAEEIADTSGFWSVFSGEKTTGGFGGEHLVTYAKKMEKNKCFNGRKADETRRPVCKIFSRIGGGAKKVFYVLLN
jgi:hypothetical protein